LIELPEGEALVEMPGGHFGRGIDEQERARPIAHAADFDGLTVTIRDVPTAGGISTRKHPRERPTHVDDIAQALRAVADVGVKAERR
jgi:hypothetical protein